MYFGIGYVKLKHIVLKKVVKQNLYLFATAHLHYGTVT